MEEYYLKHRQSIKKWQQKNPEKVRQYALEYQHKMKKENPDLYEAMLKRKKEYYINVVKPRNEKKKQDLLAYYMSKETETAICKDQEPQI